MKWRKDLYFRWLLLHIDDVKTSMMNEIITLILSSCWIWYLWLVLFFILLGEDIINLDRRHVWSFSKILLLLATTCTLKLSLLQNCHMCTSWIKIKIYIWWLIWLSNHIYAYPSPNELIWWICHLYDERKHYLMTYHFNR